VITSFSTFWSLLLPQSLTTCGDYFPEKKKKKKNSDVEQCLLGMLLGEPRPLTDLLVLSLNKKFVGLITWPSNLLFEIVKSRVLIISHFCDIKLIRVDDVTALLLFPFLRHRFFRVYGELKTS
jgi:hypothetical protein